MKVFHFINEKYGMNVIKQRRLKISRINELNDPFEFLGVNLSDKKLRLALNETKKELSKTKGLICFSKNWHNPVQWTHYADRHKGLCLEFDVSNNLLEKVDYVNERLIYEERIDFETMKKILKTKFEHWSYEEEYRAFISLDPLEEENGKYFINFDENLKLCRVIVGCLSTISRQQLAEIINKFDYEVESFKARIAFTKFEVVRNRNEKLWS